MNQLSVRIIHLGPTPVAVTYGFGSGPEDIAWKKMITFVKAKGLHVDGKSHRYLGFNNPDPTPASPNYGYEQWITIDSGVEGTEDAKIKEFGGGLYAVARCQLKNIGEVWKQLVAWREKSAYRSGNHQWLEEVVKPPVEEPITEESEIDLYLPIIE